MVVGLLVVLMWPAQAKAAPTESGSTPIQSAVASVAPPGFQDSVALSGLTEPMNIEFARDGRIFVAEKRGTIKVFDSLTDTVPDTFADLTTNVHSFWDRGLVGLALAPSFPDDPYLYVLYNYDAPIGGTAPTWGTPGIASDPCPTPPGAGTDGCVVSGRLSRLQAAGNTMTGPEQVLINDWCQQFAYHTVDDLGFGADGALYASAGEAARVSPNRDWGQWGGSAGSPTPKNPCGDPPTGVGGSQTLPTAEGGSLRSQDVRTSGDPTGLDGTIIRVDPATGAAWATNPAQGPDENARRIIAHGFRNPFRFTFRPGTNEVWVGDVGESRWEEIDRVVAPTAAVRNFGWPCYEGAPRHSSWDSFDVNICEGLYAQTGAVTDPFFAYPRQVPVFPGDVCPLGSASISGLAFYEGGTYPAEYQGALFFADYARNCIWVMPADASGVPDAALGKAFVTQASNPVDLEIGPNGDLFYVDHLGGTIRRVTYFSANQPPTARIAATPTSGAPPLAVSFDGTGSSDPENGALVYGWDLDDDGAYDDSTEAQPSFTFTSSGSHLVRLMVTDPSGATDTESIVISVGNSSPVASIDAPSSTIRWTVGDRIDFAGSATDTEDGTLPASALSWSLILHHCAVAGGCHEHALQSYAGVAGGSFTTPDHAYPAYLELRLTATDSGGLRHTVSRQLDPRTIDLSFRTQPSGLQLSVEGTDTTPFERTVISGSSNPITGPTPQTLGGTNYEFVAWSDGGAATHDVAPTEATTYTATYRAIDATAVYADDRFTRTVVNSWGSTVPGGTYALQGTAADYDVTGSLGTIAVGTGGNRSAVLNSVSALDVDLSFRARTDKTAAGGAQFVYGIARRINATNEYRAKMRRATNGNIYIQASSVVNGIETALGVEAQVPGLSTAPNTFIWLRAQLTGANPTTIRMRAWADGSSEPTTWQYTTTSSAGPLQAAGAVGVRAYLSSSTTNAPVLVTFDDYRVTSIGPANQAPVFTTNLTDRTDAEGATVSMDADATDPDGDTLTYSATNLPNGITINPTTGVISGTLSSTSSGTYSVTVTVSDGTLTATDPFTWTVTQPATTVYVDDTFGRTATDTWASAPTGGLYTLGGTAANYDVAGGLGTMVVPTAGASRSALLNTATAHDVELSFRVRTDKLAVGGSQFIYAVVRRSGTNEYRVKLRLAANGNVLVSASTVIANVESPIGSEVAVAGLTHTANGFIRLRAQVTGASPTTIRVRAWADSAVEPTTWQYTATNSAASLQGTGSLGLRTYISSGITNAPVLVTFDDYRVTSIP
ncbi:MAG: PQQ-dependent sugar dehydrogenase [Chloroflexi bacterium]|nr:PQQ-dependent sugar dehydrogenase [Chloroflexota bacterium]